jgi:hypothetical protein
MEGKVFIYNNCSAFRIRAMNLAEVTCYFMRLHLFSLQTNLATLFEETITFVWAVHYFERAILSYMLFNISSFNLTSAVVFALNDCLWAIICDVLIHIIKWEHNSTSKQAFDNSKRALLIFVSFNIPPQN